MNFAENENAIGIVVEILFFAWAMLWEKRLQRKARPRSVGNSDGRGIAQINQLIMSAKVGIGI